MQSELDAPRKAAKKEKKAAKKEEKAGMADVGRGLGRCFGRCFGRCGQCEGLEESGQSSSWSGTETAFGRSVHV